MSLVSGTLLIASFFLPGIFFRSGYFSSRQDSFKQRLQLSVLGDIIWISWLSIIFNILGAIITKGIGYSVDYGLFYKVINGQDLSSSEVDLLSTSVPLVTSYITILSVCTYILGAFSSKTITYFKLYRTPYLNSILNFKNNWFFLLSGEDVNAGPDFLVKIDAVVDFNNGGYLYTGYIESFELKNTDEGLSTITLVKVFRRELSKDSIEKPLRQTIDARYYSVPGHRFILKYADIKSLNITFVNISTTKPDIEVLDLPEQTPSVTPE